jgi:hypothetical protein
MTLEQVEKQRQAHLADIAAWNAAHPVSAGLIPCVNYVEPRWSYTPAPRQTFPSHERET